MTRHSDTPAFPVRLSTLLILLCLLPAAVPAQEQSVALDRHMLRLDMTGSLEPVPEAPAAWSEGAAQGSRRSPLLAGALSLALPGAGEVYAGSYILAGLFFGAEVTGWYFANSYDTKGDDQTLLFQNYADAHWSAVKYARWLNENAKSFPGGENTKPIDISSDESLPHWERVNWTQMNEVEMAIPVFSHRLPRHGHQQYFELIGKYDQYSFGWDDKSDGGYREISTRFRQYADMRGEANDFYTVSERIVSLVIINHVLSAVDAAWAAARFNSVAELHSSVKVRPLPSGMAELVPEATFRIRL
ncbi:MAG: hypothetical protein HY962_11825 [Ignavibacteriae bacterium]|nr:hypothetical protein [Ignavibacteriota bacterium]